MKMRALLLAGVLLAVIWPAAALAHEHRPVGKYELEVGFLNEPALVDEPNGVYFEVVNDQTKQPVEGLAQTVKVTVFFGATSKEYQLRPKHGEPGAYRADFIPTAAGTYLFHFTGTIEGMPVNEHFESGPGRFNDVESKAALEFPSPRLSPEEVRAQLQSAGQATTFGFIGIALGALGAILGAAALAFRRR